MDFLPSIPASSSFVIISLDLISRSFESWFIRNIGDCAIVFYPSPEREPSCQIKENEILIRKAKG